MTKTRRAVALLCLAATLIGGSALKAAAEEAEAAPPFPPTIYFGPSFGYSSGDSDHYAWSMQVLARFMRYAGVQMEYFNGGTSGLYVGGAPILPLGDSGASLYAQLGGAFGGGDSGVAAGGGLMYTLPIELLKKGKVDLTFRVDYKYLDVDGGDHMLTSGIMLGLAK